MGVFTMETETVVSTAIGIIIGGFITWLFSWIYYKKAGEELQDKALELKNETQELKTLMTKLGKFLDFANKGREANLNYDERGNIVGYTVKIQEWNDLKIIHGKKESNTEQNKK